MLQWFSTSFWPETATQSALHVSCVWLLLFCEARESSRRASQLQAVPVELGAPWQWVGWIGNEDWWRSGGCCSSKLYIRTGCNYGLEKSSEHSKLCSKVAKGDYSCSRILHDFMLKTSKDCHAGAIIWPDLHVFACFPRTQGTCIKPTCLSSKCTAIRAWSFSVIIWFTHIRIPIYIYLFCIILPYEFICMFFDHWLWLLWNRKAWYVCQ